MSTFILVECTCRNWPYDQDPYCEQHRTPDKLVSHSELDTYRQCEHKHMLAYDERWQLPKDSILQSPALSRGTLYHLIMETHYGLIKRLREEYGAKPTSEDLTLAIAPFLYEELTGEYVEHGEICEWMYRGYVDHYGLDPEWEIVEVERKFELRLPAESGRPSRITLKGTVDLLVIDHSAGGGLWIVDHKTCKNLPKDLEIDLDDQAAVYMYLLRKRGLNIRGHIRNAVRTEKLKTREMEPKERFLRRLSVRTDEELKTMATEAMQKMRAAWKPRHGAEAPRSPNPDTCRWKCQFTQPCLAGRKLGPERERQMLADMGFVQRALKPGPTFEMPVRKAARSGN